MNIIEFQKKLGELLSAAQVNDNKISTEQVEKSLRELLLTPEQVDKVYEYLAAEKITVAGRKPAESEKTAEKSVETPPAEEKKLTAPLDEEEKRYLKNYMQTLEQLPSITKESLEKAAAAAVAGNEAARQKVIEAYMPKVVDMALELHYGTVFLGDEIAEGNLSLLSVIRELKTGENMETHITEAVRIGILRLSEEQNEQQQRDGKMVEKVRNLEEKIREITEDGELQFSVDELAVFMDMSRKEIEDVLRLTGEGEKYDDGP